MTAAPLSATPNDAKCERSTLHQSHSTPSVVFLSVNIYMRTAFPRATNGKNRSNMSALFSAARAARPAMFNRWVTLKKLYLVSDA